MRNDDGGTSSTRFFNSSYGKANHQDPESTTHFYLEQSWMVSRQIQMKRCVSKRDGIKVQPSSIDDHQVIIQMLDKGSHEYHTFKLPDMVSILRGIPEKLSTDEVKQTPMKVGFDVKVDSRMHNKIEGTRIEHVINPGATCQNRLKQRISST